MNKNFAEQIRETLANQHTGHIIDLQEVINADGVHLGITIRSLDNSIAPTVYLDNFSENDTIDHIAEQIWELFTKYELPADDAVLDEIKALMDDRDEILRRVMPRISNSERSAEFAQTHVNRKILDLTITYHVPLKNIQGSWCITNQASDLLELYEEEIHTAAMMNLNSDVSVKKMSDVVGGFMPVDVNMMIVSNAEGIKGAAVMLSDTIEELAEEFHDNVVILPASVHEVIAIPESLCVNTPLMQIVREVNATTVSTEDFLSNSVYIFDRESEELRIAG